MGVECIDRYVLAILIVGIPVLLLLLGIFVSMLRYKAYRREVERRTLDVGPHSCQENRVPTRGVECYECRLCGRKWSNLPPVG